MSVFPLFFHSSTPLQAVLWNNSKTAQCYYLKRKWRKLFFKEKNLKDSFKKDSTKSRQEFSRCNRFLSHWAGLSAVLFPWVHCYSLTAGIQLCGDQQMTDSKPLFKNSISLHHRLFCPFLLPSTSSLLLPWTSYVVAKNDLRLLMAPPYFQVLRLPAYTSTPSMCAGDPAMAWATP